jgi:PAS domain S-box-containing protein
MNRTTSPPPANEIASAVVDHISAMLAYWDVDQKCHFANEAYRVWFGRSPQEMLGITMKELLGPVLYEKNLPYILAALSGKPQLFERQIPLPDGRIRESIATYTPDIADGVVRGFFVHVADVTPLKERESALREAIRERDQALAEVRTLRGLLSICSYCKSIQDPQKQWQPMETYISQRSQAKFSHGICPKCLESHYPQFCRTEPNPPPA